MFKLLSVPSKRPLVSSILASAQRRSVASVNQTTPNKDVLHIADVVTTQEMLNEIDAITTRIPSGYLDFNYKSKHPDVSFEEYNRRFAEELRRPFIKNDELLDLGEELLGFGKEELEQGATATIPQLFTADGELDADKFQKVYGGGTQDNDQFVADFVKDLVDLDVLYDESFKEPEQAVFDEEYWKKELGSATVAEVNRLYEHGMAQVPSFDAAALERRFEEKIAPLFEQYKDILVDQLEEFKKVNRELEFLSIFLDVDEEGVPRRDFDSFQFWETYFPEEVDQAIEEIDRDNWEIEYDNDDPKLARLGPEALHQRNKEWLLKEIGKMEDDLKKEMAVAASVSEEEKAFQKMYADVLAIARSNKQTEAEISQMKFQIGMEDSEGAKKKEEKVVRDPATEKILDRVLSDIMENQRPRSKGDPTIEANKDTILRQIKNLLAGKEADYVKPESDSGAQAASKKSADDDEKEE